MRSRTVLAFCILLLFALAACSSQPADTGTNSAAQGSSNAAGGPTGSTSAKRAEAAPPVVVPADTTLTVRLGESLGSKISTAGQSFSATLATPVEVEGRIVIPAGAQAQGTVIDAKPLGRFKGGAVLEVRLTSIEINGRDRAIETSAVIRTQKGKGKRTAVLAGGGAGLGALVGGLAGGGKGAAIGALAGGGAGGAGAAFTGNKEIVLPAEAALSFKLTAPLEVRMAR